MRSDEERIELLHRKSAEIRKKHEKMKLYAYGCISLLMFAAFIGVTYLFSGTASGISGTGFAASSLLDSSAGGYIAVGVAAFMLGVIVAVKLKKHRS